MTLLKVLVLFLVSSNAWGDEVSTDTPPCDPNIVGQDALKRYFPTGVKVDMTQLIKKNSPYSYTFVSKANADVNGAAVECINVVVPDASTATVVKKFYVDNVLKEVSEDFTVKQKDYYLEYQSKSGKESYNLYVLPMNNDVFITYKCCENCAGKSPNVGVAIPDKRKDDISTKATVTEAKIKLQLYQLDTNAITLQACPDVKSKKE